MGLGIPSAASLTSLLRVSEGKSDAFTILRSILDVCVKPLVGGGTSGDDDESPRLLNTLLSSCMVERWYDLLTFLLPTSASSSGRTADRTRSWFASSSQLPEVNTLPGYSSSLPARGSGPGIAAPVKASDVWQRVVVVSKLLETLEPDWYLANDMKFRVHRAHVPSFPLRITFDAIGLGQTLCTIHSSAVPVLSQAVSSELEGSQLHDSVQRTTAQEGTCDQISRNCAIVKGS